MLEVVIGLCVVLAVGWWITSRRTGFNYSVDPLGAEDRTVEPTASKPFAPQGRPPQATLKPTSDERKDRTQGGSPDTSHVTVNVYVYVNWWTHQRVRPIKPRRKRAGQDWVGFKPAEQLLVPAMRCRICNRPLTNSSSQRQGVGPDCLKRYGSRVVHRPNPDYIVWQERKQAAIAKQAAEQAAIDRAFRKAQDRYEREMRMWRAARAQRKQMSRSPSGTTEQSAA